MKLSDYVVQFIADRGVRHIFLVPGGGAMHLVDSAGGNPNVEFVCNLHEQASALAAAAYAKITSNLGVALVTSGPGGTNAVTGVADAWLDSEPCLFISGQVKRADLKGDTGLRQLGVQEVDIVSIVKPITKYAITVLDPKTVRYHLEKAVYHARGGRPGPVWIDIPLDVQAATIIPEELTGFEPGVAETLQQDGSLASSVSLALELLSQSERPVLLAGRGVRLAGAEDNLTELAERLGIPVLTTWAGIDLVPDAHPLFVGRPGSMAPRAANFALQNSDWMLALGARLDMTVTAYAPGRLARAAKKIMVDVDPAELEKMGAAIDIPVCADAGHFIEEMLSQSGRSQTRDRSSWVARCQDWKARYPVILPEYRQQRENVSTYVLTDVLSELLTDDDVIVQGSSGIQSEVFLLAFRVKKGQRVVQCGALGAMGYGIPASIGACLASGNRRTICVDGDGGFQPNAQELETATRLNLPIKFLVVNNRGYACVRSSQQAHFRGHLVASDSASGLSLPEIAGLASAYKIPFARISNQANLREGLEEVLETRGPVVCEIMAPLDEPRAPRVTSAQRADGSMVSKPLEDMWPFLDREEFLANMIVPPLDDDLRLRSLD